MDDDDDDMAIVFEDEIEEPLHPETLDLGEKRSDTDNEIDIQYNDVVNEILADQFDNLQISEDVIQHHDVVNEILADQFDNLQISEHHDEHHDVVNEILEFDNFQPSYTDSTRMSDFTTRSVYQTNQTNENEIGADNILAIKTHLKHLKVGKIENIDNLLKKYYEKIKHLNPLVLRTTLNLITKNPQKKKHFEELRYTRFIERLEKEIKNGW